MTVFEYSCSKVGRAGRALVKARTSSTMAPAASPTDFMVSALNQYGSMAPRRRKEKVSGSRMFTPAELKVRCASVGYWMAVVAGLGVAGLGVVNSNLYQCRGAPRRRHRGRVKPARPNRWQSPFQSLLWCSPPRPGRRCIRAPINQLPRSRRATPPSRTGGH